MRGRSPRHDSHVAREWRKNLPPERRLRTRLRGGWLFARGGTLYALLFVGAFLLPSPWMRVVCLVLLPFAIGALFVIGHDAAHHSLTPSRWFNRIVGRLAMLPAYHPYTSWSYTHNILHHGGTCLKGTHPDFPPFSKEEFDRLPSWRRRLERIYRSPLGVGLCYALEFYRRYLLFPPRALYATNRWHFHFDRLLVIAFLGVQLWAAFEMTAIVPPPSIPRSVYMLVAIVVPWLAWLYFMGIATFVQHTHPRTVWYADEAEWSFYHVQLHSSTHMVLPWPLESILHNIMDHPAHHIDPTIPLYELAASQKLLEEQAPDDSVVVTLTLTEYLRICRSCKLYDYRHHRWLDFEGRPTADTGEAAYVAQHA